MPQTAITLLDAINRTSRTIGLSQAAGHPERALIVDWYNEAVDQFLVDTKMVVKTVSLACTAGVGDYTLDAQIIALKDLYYVPVSGTSFLMQPVDATEIQSRRLLNPSVIQTPELYALAGSTTLMVWPTPTSSTDAIHGLYAAHAASAMTADTHQPDTDVYGGIPVEWHPTLLDYVLWQAGMLAKDELSQAGELYHQRWMAGLQRAKMRQAFKLGRTRSRAVPGYRNKGAKYATNPGVDVGY